MASGEHAKSSDLYLRRASGLVRTAGPWSGLAFNWIWTGNSIGIVAAFILISFPTVAPGLNFVALIISATLLSVLNSLVYMFFAMIMPRSGGDYHFISRTLHPSLGFMSSVNWALWLPLVLGFGGSLVSPLILGSLVSSWGVATHNPGLVAFATSVLADKNMTFAIGAIVIIVFTVITLLGTKVYFALQNLSFVLMLVGIAITIAAFATNTPASFANLIDNALGQGTYNATIQSFQSQYQSIQALERPAAIAIPSGIVLWAGVNTWAMGTSLIAGEVKEERKLRTWLIANVLGTLFTGASFALTTFLYFNSVGDKFIYAITYLNGSPNYKLEFLPYYSSFIPLAFPNIVIFVIFAAAFFLGGIFYFPQNQILSSRVMLAWSFDRIMPAKLGYVDKKFHNPVVATLICLAVALIALWIYVYTPWLGFFSQLFAVAFSFFLTSIAAIVYPFKKKEMFESSPVRWRIGGLPLMTLIGVANAIFMLVFMYQNWTDSTLGSNSPQSLMLIVGIFIAAFVLYWGIRAYRKSQGIDIDAVFRELPPE